jgi:ferrous iron transport protein B
VIKKKLTIALAGNANVGKSVIFNQLTGLHQHIGNWPGKTVEKAEGTLYFKGYKIDIIDLPGIYSLSTYSLEELVSREYIAVQKPNLAINVLDASVLERNLFFTLQLMELEAPMVIALNQIDIAKKKGIEIDYEKLSQTLGVPVVPTVAIKGIGVYKLLEVALETIEKGELKPRQTTYGEEIEEKIEKITSLVEKIGFKYPARWTAVKLLEGDEEVEKEINKKDSNILPIVKKMAEEIEKIHGHSCSTVMTSEKYELAGKIARDVQQIVPAVKPSMSQRLDDLTTHRVFGYLLMVAIVFSIFYTIFTFGGFASTFLSDIFYSWEPIFENMFGKGIIGELIWGGVEGIIAGVTIILPYIAPFYFLLYILEDSGYLSRVAFLMDVVMHKIGLHGKAFIPAMLAYGCNVPACLGCKIMETQRERFLAAFVVTMIPCAATTVVILGLVGTFVNIEWALTLYIIDLIIIFLLGRAAFKALPGEPTELIMEMHEYRLPHLKTVVNQTWFRLEEFIKIAFPVIIVSSLVIKFMEVLGFLELLSVTLSPVTVGWLGLRPEMGIPLVFGILRKELTLITLATLLEPAGLSILTPVQMVVFTLVTMLYMPCVATIAACVKEFGWKKTLYMTVFRIFLAIFIGGIAFRILLFIKIL